MALDTNLSILVSALLAVAWVVDARGAPQEVPRFVWRFFKVVRSVHQVLPTLLVFSVGASWSGIWQAAFSVSFMESGSGWLGPGELELWRRWALLAAMALWRAEKLESLLQRMQRCAREVQRAGFGTACSAAARDPGLWILTPSWAIARRVALVTVSSLGCTPFVLKALPAVVLDEFLWWALASFQNGLSKLGLGVPLVFHTVIFPLLDTLHFAPVVVRVFQLGAVDYPFFCTAESTQVLLIVSSLAWTVHNCHQLYQTIFQDVRDAARQLWDPSLAPA